MFVKQIFICWLQGFANAPYITKLCLLSWKLKNPTWKVIELDDSNIYDYVDKTYFEEIRKTKSIQHCHFTDILRLHLLKNHSGVWADATTFCCIPLDDWLLPYLEQEFFAFKNPGADRLLSNWFLVSSTESSILNTWLESISTYWKNNSTVNNYFVHHNLFKQIYTTDTVFKNQWNTLKSLPAVPAHYFQTHISKPILNEKVLKNDISPVQKLTYKAQVSPVRSITNYLLSELLDFTMSPDEIIQDALNIINTEFLPIVNSIKEPLEGNIFFRHNTQTYTNDFKEKRENIVIQTQKTTVKKILEIGFNAGFSTLLFLLANPNVHITCIDICIHKYTIPCKDKLLKMFPGRITFYKGSSPDVLKTLTDTYDIIHIDGCHKKEIAKQDLELSMSKCNPGCVIIMDDTHVPDLMALWRETCKKYNLQPVADYIPSKYHQIAKFSLTPPSA